MYTRIILLVMTVFMMSCSTVSKSKSECFKQTAPKSWSVIDTKNEALGKKSICRKLFKNKKLQVRIDLREGTFSRENVKHSLAAKIMGKKIKRVGYLTGEIMWQTAYYDDGKFVTYRGLVSDEKNLLTFVTHLNVKTYKEDLKEIDNLIRNINF